MKTNLDELAELLLALTWQEMNEITTNGVLSSSYSAAEPEKIIAWAENQLAKKEVML